MEARRLLDPLAPPLCVGCGAYAGRVEPLCSPCRGTLRWLDSAPATASEVELWAPLAYVGAARAVVAGLKFRGAAALAATMAAQIAARAPPGVLERSVLVPVPLQPSRRRSRGYNQSELIADALAVRTGLGVSDCLERRGRGATQMGRGRAERAREIEGAVAVRPLVPLPADCLLVDDVATTGATLAACAAALRDAGVHSVRAVVYARTPGR